MTFWIWCAIGFTVLLSHLTLFDGDFLETWFAPLHVLWVVACAAWICWWAGFRLESRASRRQRASREVTQAGFALVLAYWAVTVGVTAITVRLDWGAGMVGNGDVAAMGSFPLMGVGTAGVSIALVVVPIWVFHRRTREGRGDDESSL